MSSSKPAGRGGSGLHWSDGETSALVEAWGQLYLQRNRGSLRHADWRQVCGAVNAHRAAAGRRFDRSVGQCQWRLYNLKSQYKKGQPTWGSRHFAQLRAYLAGTDDGPPPGFATQMPPASVVKEEKMAEVEEKEEEEEEACGSVGRRTLPAKRHFSSLQDILDRSGGLPPGFPPRMPATTKKVKEEVKEEVEVGGGPANGAASAGCCPAKVATKLAEVVTKLAEVYERVEMERLSVEREKMAMERERRAAKVEAENQLGETADN